MTSPPIDADTYYQRRDDRQRRVTASADYQSTRTGLIARKDVARSREGQRGLLTAANLLARWSRTVDLDVPDADLHPGCRWGKARRLRPALKATMYRGDPFGDFVFRSPRPNSPTLQVGPAGRQDVSPSFAAWAAGWEALGWAPGRHPAPDIDAQESLFGPSLQLAVCLGVGQVFKEAIGQAKDEHLEDFRWSLWNHELRSAAGAPIESAPQLLPEAAADAGRMLQVGVGAVGSNVLYFLRHLQIQATVTLVDFDVVEVENLDRSLLFGWPDAVPVEKRKVNAAKKLLAGSSISSVAFDGAWSDFAGERLEEEPSYDIWLPLANERGVRRAMASSLPSPMIHGSTSADWEIFCGRHIPLREYCLSCRFPDGGPDPEFACSRGNPVDSEGSNDEAEQIDPSLPFVSAAAAALVVGEVLKLNHDGCVDQPNYVSANLRSSMKQVVALQHPRRDDCSTCRNAPVAAWEARVAGTKYAALLG